MQRTLLTYLLGIISLAGTCLAAHVKQSLTLTWELGNPDGHQRELVKVNGSMPGPELRFDEGDAVEVRLFPASSSTLC